MIFSHLQTKMNVIILPTMIVIGTTQIALIHSVILVVNANLDFLETESIVLVGIFTNI